MELIKELYRPVEAAYALGLGRTEVYKLMATGRLEYREHGRIRLITREAIAKFAASLPVGEGGVA